MVEAEAVDLMKRGAAIARPGWTGIHYLFYSAGKVWAFKATGKVQCFEHYFQARNLIPRNDWYVVENPSLPALPASHPKTESPDYWPRTLAERQAAMREGRLK